MQTQINLFLIGALIVCGNSLSIRDFHPEEIYDPEPEPDHDDIAAVARYVVHKSEWASIGTISTAQNISGFPMVNLKSVADSAKDEPSTGHIYFYLTSLDFTGKDLAKSNKLTAMFSNDQDLACTNRGTDPMEPTCSRIIISGSAVKLDVDSDEFKFANRAFLSRHPAAVHWIEEHSFYLCKLEIVQIIVLDWYGGAKYLEVEDYYNFKGTLTDVPKKKKNNNSLRTTSEAHHRNEDKIWIKVKKGDDSVFIEL